MESFVQEILRLKNLSHQDYHSDDDVLAICDFVSNILETTGPICGIFGGR